ncbi:MAG: gfo/Idh/MocA family oxidoreductase [Luteitalea sp.]|nr:gfo/Idh/MocA family oxidoreductase [Luteitalea sp.]
MKVNRRTFVASTAAGVVGTTSALSARESRLVQGANDRIRLGFIGVGGMGRGHLNNFMQISEAEVVVVCDVWDFARNRARKMTEPQPRGPAETESDFRRILDRKDIDAVVVATPDHWHALPTIMACEAGKDVYVEKPISHNIVEGRQMVDAARTHKRIVQVGTQQRSGLHFQEAVDMVREGKIGKVTRARTWNYGNASPRGIGSPPDGAPPAGLDWDFWLGPAPQVAFNPNRFIGSFRWFWDYAGGMMTDWGVHLLDIVQWAMNVDAPSAITAAGGKFVLEDNRETPDTLEVLFEYPEFVATYSNRFTNGYTPDGHGYGIVFYGTDGTLFVDRQGYDLYPELGETTEDPEPAYVRLQETGQPSWSSSRTVDVGRSPRMSAPGSDQNEPHIESFLECMRTRKLPISDIEIGHRSTSTCLLGNIAYRTGHKIAWDAKSEQISDDPEASKLLSRENRSRWTQDV